MTESPMHRAAVGVPVVGGPVVLAVVDVDGAVLGRPAVDVEVPDAATSSPAPSSATITVDTATIATSAATRAAGTSRRRQGGRVGRGAGCWGVSGMAGSLGLGAGPPDERRKQGGRVSSCVVESHDPRLPFGHPCP